MPPTTSGCACALVDPQAAEALRRRLDDCGYLDTGRRAFRAESGAVALPLTAAGEAYAVQHGELSLAFLPPPTTDRRTSDKRQRMHGRCVAALESSGLPRADAARLFPVQSLPSKWEKLGDVALFAPRGMFEPGSGAAEALAALAPAARESLLAALAAEAGATRLGVQGRIGQVEGALHRKSGARLVGPPGAGGWVSFIASAPARRSRGLEVKRPRVSTHALVFRLSRVSARASRPSRRRSGLAHSDTYDTLRAFFQLSSPHKNKNRRAPRGPRARRARPSERLGER